MNEELKSDINQLLPPELEEAKKFIEYLLPIKSNNRITNLEYLEQSGIFFCPVNEKHHTKKNGHKNGTQRYWCYDCKKSFSITNNKIVKYSSLNYNQLKTLLKCMYDFKPLSETALEVGISKTSVFETQIKLFDALDDCDDEIMLDEIVQADELYVRTSFKGFRKDMPRDPRYSGNSNLISGISKDQLCTIVAIDTKDNLIIKTVGNGPASIDMISKALKNKIKPSSILVTDSKSSYKEFAKENKLQLIQIPHGQYKIDNYTINDVNEIMTEIGNYLKRKRGISSRHLQHHMNFIRYRKKIKYTIEYLEINEKMYKDSLELLIKLKSNDVYCTEMPFDLNEYEDWYYGNY